MTTGVQFICRLDAVHRRNIFAHTGGGFAEKPLPAFPVKFKLYYVTEEHRNSEILLLESLV